MPTAPFSFTDGVIVVLYLLGMLGVGALVAGRVRTFADFFVAGRRMTTPILVCTLVSTYYGLDVTFGVAETSFDEGMTGFVVYSAPFYLTYAGMALLVAPRIAGLGVTSLPEAAGHFYGRPARLAVACASFLYSAPILAVMGMGIVGEVFFGWELWVGAVVGGLLALAYTVLGGLWADALTDTVQFVVMCVSLAVAAAYALIEIGGHDAIAARVGAEILDWRGDTPLSTMLVYATIALTPLVEPAFYQRVFAAQALPLVRRALLIGIPLWLAYDWVVVYLGLAGRDLVAAGVLPADMAAREVTVRVAAHLLPAGLLGLFVAGTLAAAMSTIDSYTLIASGNLVYDGWQPLRRRPLTDRQLVWWTRVGCVVTLGASLWLALAFDGVREAWIFMASMLLATALVPMLAALFVLRRPAPRAGQWSAWAGLLTMGAMIAAFEIAAGEVDGERYLRLPLVDVHLERDAAVLVALPFALIAFAAGYIADRWPRRAAR